MINFIGVDPIKALVYAVVLNGVVAVPLFFLIALISKNRKIMGKYKSRALSNVLVWMTFVGMLSATVAMLLTFLRE
jgi:Mn2+/Fe2+ NRAMP family transporter